MNYNYFVLYTLVCELCKLSTKNMSYINYL